MIDSVENHDCGCGACDHSFEEVQKKQKEAMEQYGWIVHLVPMDGYFNAHTHGLTDKYGHKELQIVFPLEPDILMGVIHTAVNRIVDGAQYHEGDIVKSIIETYSVKFINALEGDRKVLRMILPDSDGQIEKKKIEKKFRFQYTV